MAWYRQGTVSVANGSTAVVGTLTGWTNQARPEDAITFDGGSTWHEIASVNSNTSITLAVPYPGTTVSGGAYAIQRLGRGHGLVTGLSAQIATLLAQIPTLGGIGDALRVIRGNATGTAYELTDPTFGQVTVGTVTTLSPGASATVTNSGTPAAAVLNFGIPRGNATDAAELAATLGYRPAMRVGASAWLGGEEGFAIDYINRTAIVTDFRRPQLLSVSGQPEDIIPLVRGSTATFIGRNRLMQTAPANALRYHHDVVTGDPLGALLEGAEPQLLSFTEDLADASWSKANVTISSNTAGDQMGGSTADLVIPTATNSAVHSVKKAGDTVAAGATVTQSVHLQAAGYNFVLLRVGNAPESSAFQVEINLAAGTIGAAQAYGSGATALQARIEPALGTSYRVQLTGAIAGLTSYGVTAYVYNASGSPSYSGDGTSGVAMWGFDQKVGAAATGYIPRITGAAASRAADVHSAALSSLVASVSEGTLIVEAMRVRDATGYPSIASLNDGTNNNAIEVMRHPPSGLGMTVIAGGAIQVDSPTAGVITQANPIFRAAMRWRANDFAISINGALPLVDASGSVPAVTHLSLGARLGVAEPIILRRVALITRGLPNAQLQQRTA
jgi:hypothetical protein